MTDDRLVEIEQLCVEAINGKRLKRLPYTTGRFFLESARITLDRLEHAEPTRENQDDLFMELRSACSEVAILQSAARAVPELVDAVREERARNARHAEELAARDRSIEVLTARTTELMEREAELARKVNSLMSGSDLAHRTALAEANLARTTVERDVLRQAAYDLVVAKRRITELEAQREADRQRIVSLGTWKEWAHRRLLELEVRPEECPVHIGAVHGGEAEELRAGIERLIETPPADPLDPAAFREILQTLLDTIDARDSLGYLERRDEDDAREAVETLATARRRLAELESQLVAIARAAQERIAVLESRLSEAADARNLLLIEHQHAVLEAVLAGVTSKRDALRGRAVAPSELIAEADQNPVRNLFAAARAPKEWNPGSGESADYVDGWNAARIDLAEPLAAQLESPLLMVLGGTPAIVPMKKDGK